MTDVTLDYLPTIGGVPADLAAAGGAVTRLRLYPAPGRDGTPTVDVGPAVPADAGRWRFTFPRPADGTYYTVVEWTEQPDGAPVIDADDVLTIPLPLPPEAPGEGTLVAADVVARQAGFPLPLTAQSRQIVTDAIMAAQADVEAYLGRALFPETHVETLLPLDDPQSMQTYLPRVGWTPRYWLPVHHFISHPLRTDDVTSLVTAVPYGTEGCFTVTYLAGLDGPAHPAIVRFVTAHAAAIARANPAAEAAGAQRRVTSKTLQGQSITYEKEAAEGTATTPGFLPTLDSLKRYRRTSIAVYQRPVPWNHPR